MQLVGPQFQFPVVMAMAMSCLHFASQSREGGGGVRDTCNKMILPMVRGSGNPGW